MVLENLNNSVGSPLIGQLFYVQNVGALRLVQFVYGVGPALFQRVYSPRPTGIIQH